MKLNGNSIVTLAVLTLLVFLVMVNSASATVLNIKLPPDEVSLVVNYPSSNCYYDITLSNVPSGYHVSNGTYIGWCVDLDHYIWSDTTYWAKMYSTYDPANPYENGNWSRINYILNHKRGGPEDVQDAIWFFTGGEWPNDNPTAQAMINDAIANGTDFIPGPSEILAVVLYIDDHTQVPIIEVTVPIENVVPQYPLGTAIGLIAFVAAFGLFRYKNRIFNF